ncbi:hypothetical protein AB1N83_009746, partial [Pleurotus pulmonarius]
MNGCALLSSIVKRSRVPHPFCSTSEVPSPRMNEATYDGGPPISSTILDFENLGRNWRSAPSVPFICDGDFDVIMDRRRPKQLAYAMAPVSRTTPWNRTTGRTKGLNSGETSSPLRLFTIIPATKHPRALPTDLNSTVLFFLAALASVSVSAQESSASATGSGVAVPTSTAGIPNCVLQCSIQAGATAGCTFSDPTCACSTTNGFQDAATQCLLQTCTAEEQQAALGLQGALCGAASSGAFSDSVSATG